MAQAEVSNSAQSSRYLLLVVAFLAWMFAGLENSLFTLIHRQMMLDLLEPGTAESLIKKWFAWFQAAFLLGGAAGGWLFGWLGDRYGRTRAMGWSVVCYSGFTFVCWFVHDPNLMWLLRFAACLGFGGAWPNAVALVAEAWPRASRPLMAGVMGTAANFGMVLLGFIAYHFVVSEDNWRWTLLVGSSPIVLGVLILTCVPESKNWLQLKMSSAASDGTAPRRSNAPVREVFQAPLLYRTLLGISLGAIPVVGTAANANWVVPWRDQFESRKHLTAQNTKEVNPSSKAVSSKGRADREKAKTLMSRSGGAVFGSLLGGFLASLLGRRLAYFAISLATFVMSSVLFGTLTPEHPHFDLCVFLFGFFGVTYFGWLPLFLPELFPTHVRSTGTGISFNSGRIIAAAIVLVLAFIPASQLEGDYAQIGFWTGMIYIVGMIIIWFAPAAPSAGETIEKKASHA